MYIQYTKVDYPHLFLTVHAIEGHCVKGGAEGILGDRLVCTKIARIFTVNGSCGIFSKQDQRR
jgi:hypothetical protein